MIFLKLITKCPRSAWGEQIAIESSMQKFLRRVQAILACLGCGKDKPAIKRHCEDDGMATAGAHPQVSPPVFPEAAKQDLQRISALQQNRFQECAEQLLDWGCHVEER